MRKKRRSLFDRIAFLAVIGVLAGAVGGLGIGVITGKTASSPAASTPR
ncbi:MAG TPA: hypothetical protein VGM18_09890 [Candidatus Sulfotelmatobacter sp.]|jgi:F0F1-type ATP synthase membrane subunit c/vacuolar-type H+-ATPase subunit K